jgi:translation initiation factor 2 beta subunit (eIF-2beta)/eIF-5
MESKEPLPVLVHVGFHKTATTFLQKAFFDNNQLGFYQYQRLQCSNLVHKKLASLGPFDKLSSDTINELHQFAKDAAEKGLLGIISHERLSGYPASGGFDSKLILEHIKEIFPNAKILIIIREQISLIQSVYSQIITDGGGYSLSDFLRYSLEPATVRIPQFRLSFYEFDKYISYCHTLFGKERVLVLPYELLRENYQDFLDKIGFFALANDWENIKSSQKLPENFVVNAKKSILIQNISRVLNSLFYKNQLSNSALIRIKYLPKKLKNLQQLSNAITPQFIEKNINQKMKNYIREYVGSYYCQSNVRTSKLIGINLAQYNYSVVDKGDSVAKNSNV